jgi:hypothetical protein
VIPGRFHGKRVVLKRIFYDMWLGDCTLVVSSGEVHFVRHIFHESPINV